MRIIEIQPLPNGAHRNQSGVNVCPAGWAIIGDSTIISGTFPFVNITTDNGIVTTMTANQEAYDAAIAEQQKQPTQPNAMTQTQIALAELAETEAAHDLENKLALAELAELIGGTNG